MESTARSDARGSAEYRQSLLQAQFEASPDGILVVAPDRTLLSYNRRFAEMWGIPEEVLRSGSDEAVVDAVLSMVVDPDEFRRRVELCYQLPHEHRRDEVHLRDGRTFDRYSAPVLSESGEYLGLTIIFQDVTARKQAEAELERSERRFRSLTENARDLISILDPSGIALYESPASETILGYRPEELCGVNVISLIHPEDRPQVQALFERCVADTVDETVSAPVYRFRHRDGSWRSLESVATNRLHDPAVRGIIVNTRDVTSRVAAEQELQRVLSGIHCILWRAEIAWDGERMQFRPTISNEAAAREFLPVEIPAGSTYSEALYASVCPEDLERAVQIRLEALRSGAPGYALEYRVRRADGELRWLRADVKLEQVGPGRWEALGVSTDITQRKQAEEALRLSEERFRRIVETASEGIITTDAEEVVTFANPQAEEMLGAGEVALEGRPASEILLDDGAEERRRRRVAGIREEYDTRFRRLDGREGWVRVRATPLLNAQGQYLGSLSMLTDITEARLAEEQLRYVMTHAHCLIWDADVEDTGAEELWWRMRCADLEAAERFFPVEAVPGESYFNAWFRCRPEEDQRRTASYGNERMRTGESYTQEFRARDATGALRWLREDVQVQAVAPGRWRAVGVCVDVTEQRQAEQRLQWWQEQLQLVAQASRDILWRRELDSDTTQFTQAIETVLGYTAEEVGHTYTWWKEHLHPEDRKTTCRHYEAALYGTARTWSGEYRFRRKDGTYAVIFDRAFFVRDEEGRPVRAVGAMMDVSQHHELQQELRQAQKMEAIGRLAGGVAHDFNNMLAVINGYSSLLLPQFPPDSPIRHSLEEVHRAGERAAALTRQLLAFSRKQMLETRILDLNEVVGGISKMLRRLIGEDIRLETQLAAGLPPLKADPTQIEQVLMNLAVNSRDAMPGGGVLAIRTRSVKIEPEPSGPSREVPPGRYLCLEVEDTGCGMSAEVQAHVFEPFFTTKPQGEGTGLGLATVYGIVRQSGGYIELHSREDAGTRFELFFPVAGETPGDEDSRREARVPRGTETVLVVEDEEMVARLLRDVLEYAGYTVISCRGAEEAFTVLGREEQAIDLLITDVVMPGMNGRQLAEQAARLRPALKILYISGYTDDALLRAGISTSEVAFVQKPFSPATLLQKVHELLRVPGAGARRERGRSL
ncbi:MAG: PAS domain S-box protein [Armatimonadota bacterium]